MGVYIFGLDMPEEGQMLDISIYPDGKVTLFYDLYCKQIATAYQVPEHGRLVDADALKTILENSSNALTVFDAIREIDTMPTVIPEEEP